MTEAARRVRQLEEFVLTRRALSALSEEQEEAILEEMDDLWLKMTEEERKVYKQRCSSMHPKRPGIHCTCLTKDHVGRHSNGRYHWE